jgi:sulfur-carrier protein adenylyltransferase/sulfurtransferase
VIQLTKLFKPVASLEADEARDYFAQHQEGDYLILDVRQPGEYQESHIPGSKLLPLPELANSYKSLDPDKPTIVYCAVGGRSRVAAQMLSGFGFKELYNLAGGIKAYQGHKATGPQELNLEMVRGDETPTEITRLACGFERALQLFYETMQGRTPDKELQDLFRQLAQVEVHHRQKLRQLYQQLEPAGQEATACAAIAASETMEGGFNLQEFMSANEAYLDTLPHVLDLAMMLETQALDLYLRFADRCTGQATKTILFAIAAEEKIHLVRLGRLLEEKLAVGG